MKKQLLVPLFLVSFAATFAGSVAAHNDERFDHFKGEPAETLEQAVANFASHNERLANILAQEELDTEALVTIHQLTYTLENALEKINDELNELADVLEELHQASETADLDGTRNHARAYLETARKVIP